MPDDKRTALALYRFSRAQGSIEAAKEMIDSGHYLDSKHITIAFQIRNESDYEDFFLASKNDAVEQLENAGEILAAINAYIKSKTSVE